MPLTGETIINSTHCDDDQIVGHGGYWMDGGCLKWVEEIGDYYWPAAIDRQQWTRFEQKTRVQFAYEGEQSVQQNNSINEMFGCLFLHPKVTSITVHHRAS